MPASFTHKSFKNSLFNAGGFIWPIGLSLIFTPYIVHNLGKEAYGILSIVSVVTGYFAFLNLGLGSAGIKYISEYYARKEFKTVNSIINLLTLVYGIIGLIGLIGITLLTDLLANTVFDIPPKLVEVTKFALYIAAFGFFITFLKSVFEAIPKAIHRFDIENIIKVVFGTLSTLLVVLLLYFGYGLKEIVILKLVLGFAILITYLLVAKKLFPFYQLEISFDKTLIKKLFSFGGFHLFTSFINLISQHANKLVIGMFLGPATLTFFVIPQNLTSRVNGLAYKLSEIIFPLASELSSTNQHQRLINIYLKMSRITLTFKLAIFIPLIFFAYKILFFWMGKEFADEGWIVMTLLCIGFFLTSITQIPGMINMGYGNPKLNAIFSLIGIVIYLAQIVPFTKMWGIIGSALAWTTGTMLNFVFIYVTNKRTLKLSNSFFFKSVFLKPCLNSLIQIALIIFVLLNFTNSLFSLIVLFLFSFLFYFITAYFMGIYEKQEKDQLISFIKPMIKKIGIK
jgi:O-antigen/teichoic acid export membrane protein